MTTELLEKMVAGIAFEGVPEAWNTFDLERFSRSKPLWDHQVDALKNAIMALQRYYDQWYDFEPSESDGRNERRKRRFYDWYDLEPESLDIVLHSKNDRDLVTLLRGYYQPLREVPLAVHSKVHFAYRDFINRMCFWMATASGKTIVLIKLIEILHQLIDREEVPDHDILMLTSRPDLIRQFKSHVQEFNASHGDVSIRLYELKRYERVKRDTRLLPGEVPVFYYQRTGLREKSGPVLVDFANIENEGRWYVLLDEAHKGDSVKSRPQQIYSILSRNGFLFNFSATFTDDQDITTTVYNFNLAKFIRGGYGKHITVLKHEIRAFRESEDYTVEAKQKVVLKSLLMLAYVQQFRSEVAEVAGKLYHKPLLVVFGQTVNTDEADVRLFLRELARIARGEVEGDTWEAAKKELWEELRQGPEFVFEDGSVEVRRSRFEALSLDDVREGVFNERNTGEIEVLRRASDQNELAFRLKIATTSRPFALINIGDAAKFLREELEGYEVSTGMEHESYFERLSEPESDINILMGSRKFYEGWDINRPNVMSFVNIGMSADAQKFITQSVGRGVRIEPVPDSRQRLWWLYNEDPGKFGELVEDIRRIGKLSALPIETLFIFGTNQHALRSVISHLDQRERADVGYPIEVETTQAAKEHRLLIPVFRRADHLIAEETVPVRFQTTKQEYRLLRSYIEALKDEVLVARHNVDPRRIDWVRTSFEDWETYYSTDGAAVRDLGLLVHRVFKYFGETPGVFDRLKRLEDEINHFEQIRVTLENLSEVQQKADDVRDYPARRERLREQYGKIPPAEYDRKSQAVRRVEHFERDGQRIRIEYIAQHYYIPIILSEDGRADFIKHIIEVESEVRFVNDLNKYLEADDNLFDEESDWWHFCKLDEYLDKVGLPYYHPKANRVATFKPDFIFWLKRGDDYYIVFVDPKGSEHTGYQHKIKGYCHLFEDGSGQCRALKYQGLTVKVFVCLLTDDVGSIPDPYKRHWFHSIHHVLKHVLGQP